jgi:hypothetical protein
MTIGEESGNVILEIFQKECSKPGDSMTNKHLHDIFFKKTQSGLGFMDGLRHLVQKRWLAANPNVQNSHTITKSGWAAEV